MINAVAQTKPISEELRAEVNELRSTAARLMKQASRLVEKCAELEDLISRRDIEANQVITIAYRTSNRVADSGHGA